jgi:hypothetical protein
MDSRSSIFVFALEVIVCIVAGIFLLLAPSMTYPAPKKKPEVDSETTPLLRVDHPDGGSHGGVDRRSPSIGYNSSV